MKEQVYVKLDRTITHYQKLVVVELLLKGALVSHTTCAGVFGVTYL